MLELPILSKLRTGYILMAVLCVVVFIVSIYLLTTVLAEPLHRYIVIGIAVFLPAMLKFTKQRDIIGSVTLSSDTIRFRTGSLNENIDTAALNLITIRYKGYEGKTKGFYPPRAPHTGNDNLIIFTHNSVEHKFRIFLSSRDIAPLNDILLQWRAKNIGVAIRGNFGRIA